MLAGKEDVHSPPEKKPETTNDEKLYPCGLASHEDVLKDPVAFMDTLKKFHSTLGTRFIQEMEGGDIYFQISTYNYECFLRVEKVLLYFASSYEQVYFFKRRGPLVPPAAASLSVKSPSCRSAYSLASESVTTPTRQPQDQQQEQEIQVSKRRRRNKTSLQIGAPLDSTVVGIIDGKFEHGYLVSVKLGSEVLHGVLYHPGRTEDNGGSAGGIVASGRLRRRRKGGGGIPITPNLIEVPIISSSPRSTPSLSYCIRKREREFSKMIGESWNKLTPEERMVYQACGLKDKERYKKEMQEYRERLKLLQPNEGMSERPRRRVSAVSSCLVPDQAAIGGTSTTTTFAAVGTVDE